MPIVRKKKDYQSIHLKTLKKKKQTQPRESLVVQWLGLGTFTAKSLASIPDQRTKIPQAMWHSQENKKHK